MWDTHFSELDGFRQYGRPSLNSLWIKFMNKQISNSVAIDRPLQNW